MAKVCDSAHFLCDFAHSAQGYLLNTVKSISKFYTNFKLFTPICEGEILKRADVF